MEKGKSLKYIILICLMMISFFVFTNGEVNALEFSVNDDKIVLELEQVDEMDVSKGYVISGARLNDGVDTVDGFTIPSVYSDDNHIVGIKGSSNNQIGVLNNIASSVRGVVVLGENLTSIGKCAFCNFSNVTKYVLNEKLNAVEEYAFAYNESLTTLDVKAYNGEIRTELANVNVFNSSVNIKRFVFKNYSIASVYKQMNVWKELTGTFTYKITYRFFNEDNQTIMEEVDYYYSEKLGNLPDAPEDKDGSKKGLNFNWVSESNDKVLTNESIAFDVGHIDNITLNPVHDVKQKWSLKGSNSLYIKTIFNGTETNHTEDNKSISVTYMGKNVKMSIIAVTEHDLIDPSTGKFADGFDIEYSWVKVDSYGMGSSVIGNDMISIFRTGESGLYRCAITIKYLNYLTVSEEIEINVNILKKNITLNISDYEVNYGTYVEGEVDITGKYFEVDESTPFTDGEIIKSFNYDGYCKNVNGACEKTSVGTLERALGGTVLEVGYDGDSGNYVSDYNFSYVEGTLTILPKEINHTLSKNIDVTYGQKEELTEIINVQVYGEITPIVINYIREDVSNVNVGAYEVIGAFVLNGDTIDLNYDIQLADVNVGKIVIQPKKVSIDWDIDDNLVYDKSEKEVKASYKDIKNKSHSLFVRVTKKGKDDILKNAGDYKLIASMIDVDNNYELIDPEYDVKIEKADSVLIGSQTQTVTYNGKEQRVNLSLNHSEGTIVYGDYSSCKNAGASVSSVCAITVRVDVPEDANYNPIGDTQYYLRILKYRLEVAPELFTRTYGTAFVNLNICDVYKGVNDENVSICFDLNDASSNDTILPVGFYEIKSAYTNNSLNYDVVLKENTGLDKVQILPAPIQVSFHFYEGLKYDGNVKNIKVKYEGTLDDVGLSLDYCGKDIIRDAGNYRIEASISNPNYYIEGDNYIEFSIAKAKYDVSNLKLSDKEVKFNFKNHFINLEGEVPEGLDVTYTIDDHKGNGTYLPFKHTIKVSFIGDYFNYEYVEPLEATLNVDMTWVFVMLASILGFGLCIPVIIYLLIKNKIIRFTAIIRRHRVRRVIKKHRELEKLNKMFREKQALWNAANNEVEEPEIIEEPIKFVKNHVNTTPESLIKMAFVDELFRASYGTKQFYSEVKNEFLSYEGIVSKIKRDYETFYLNNMPVAKLDVVDGILYVYLALDPTQYKREEYNHANVSKEKDFVAVPLKMKVDTIDALRHTKMFIRIIRKKEGIKSVSNFIRTDYVKVYTAKDHTLSLFKKAFVKKGTKEYIED